MAKGIPSLWEQQVYKSVTVPKRRISREPVDFSGFWTAIFRVYHDRFAGEGR
jgi:hypothetical protein